MFDRRGVGPALKQQSDKLHYQHGSTVHPRNAIIVHEQNAKKAILTSATNRGTHHETRARHGKDQDLKIRSRRLSVTILVRQRGHSLVLFMIRSEQPRHIAKCLSVIEDVSSISHGRTFK